MRTKAKQSVEAIKKYMETWGADGHSIIVPESLVEMGFTKAFVKANSRTYKSDNSYKGSIFGNDGKRMNTCKGVYSLDFLYAIAEDIGADRSGALSKTGRGFQAGELVCAIRDVLGMNKQEC